MNPSGKTDSISTPNRKRSGLAEALRLVELVVSIVLAITPVSLSAFVSISGT